MIMPPSCLVLSCLYFLSQSRCCSHAAIQLSVSPMAYTSMSSLSLPALALGFLLFPLFHRAIFSGKRQKTRGREARTLSDATSSSRVVIIIKIRLNAQNATTERQKGSRSNLTHKLDSTSRAPPKRSHKRRNICISLVAIILLVVVLIVILAFTVFKAKHPVTKVNSVELEIENLQVSLRSAPPVVDLNVTLDLDLSVKNPNNVGIKYENSTAPLHYRGEVVGEVPIPTDEISADETKWMNLTLTVLADRFLSNSHKYSDYLSRVLPLNTYRKMSGKPIIMGLFKVHVVSTTSCDLSVFVSNRTVGDQRCRYKTKFKS